MKRVILILSLSAACLGARAQDTVKIKTSLTPDQEAENAYNAALEMMGKKDYNNAIENFTKAVTLNPNFEKAYLNRGYARYAAKSNEAAISDFNKVNSLKPNADAYFGKAQSYYAIGRRDSSMHNLDQAIATDSVLRAPSTSASKTLRQPMPPRVLARSSAIGMQVSAPASAHNGAE